MPTKIREYLKDHPEFITEEPHTRLAGSYARSTAIKEIKDVDILVFCDQTWRDKPIADLLSNLETTLKGLPEALEDCGEVSVRKQRRSVNIELTDHDLSLDVVPVLKTGAGTDIHLEVPDREWDDWVFTHPLGYACILSGLNGDHSGKVVPMVKLWKHWRDVQFPVKNRPKSYWLESLLVQLIKRGTVTTAGKGDGILFADLCDAIYDRFSVVYGRPDDTPFIPDGALRNHVAWNWKRGAFETFMNRLTETRTAARKAVDTDDPDEAIKQWKRVFGDAWFPGKEDFEQEYKQLVALSASGGLFVTSSGQVVTQKSNTVSSIASPAKRFFGGQ